jgi:hypothetical protein
MQAFAPEFSEAMAALLEPRQGMKSREVPGGTGPGSVASALTAAKQRLKEMTA